MPLKVESMDRVFSDDLSPQQFPDQHTACQPRDASMIPLDEPPQGFHGVIRQLQREAGMAVITGHSAYPCSRATARGGRPFNSPGTLSVGVETDKRLRLPSVDSGQ